MKNKGWINITVKQRIYWSFSVLVLLFVVNGIITITTLNNNRQSSQNITNVIDPSLQSLEDFEDVLVQSKMYTTNWVFLRSSQEDKDALVKLHDSYYPALKQKLNLLITQWDNKPMAGSLRKIFTDFEALLVIEKEIMASLSRFEDYDDPVIKLEAEAMVEDELLPRTSALMNELGKVVFFEEQAKIKSNKALEKSSTYLRMLIMVLAIIIIIIGILLSIYMSKAIINPINKIRHIVNDLGKGIIRKSDRKINYDEIGDMIHSVNNLSEKLRATATFATEIGNRNFDTDFEPLSKDDSLGIALLTMRDNIKISDAKLNDAQHIAHIGSWERDIKTDNISLSDEMLKIFDLDPASFDYQFLSIMKFIHPDDRGYAMNISRKNLYMDPVPYECRIITDKGVIKNIFVETKVVLGSYGEVEKTFGIVQDITERKKAALAIEESDAFSRGVLDSLSSHIAVINASGTIIKVNKPWNSFATNNGATTLEKCGEGANYFDVCKSQGNTEDDIPGKAMEGIKKVLDGSLNDFYLQYPCHSPEEERWFYIRVMKFESSETLVLIEHQNITEQVLSAKRVAESEEKYRQIVETAQEGIWMIDENNFTVLVNKKMADLLEYTPEEMMGKQNYCFMDEEWKKKGSEDIERRKLGMDENHDFKYITKSGKEVWTNLSTNPVFADDGTYQGALAMVTDITQRKLDEELLRKSEVSLEINNKELLQKNKELEQFAYVASHDLQEPLRTASSFVDLLQRQYRGKLDENADKYLTYITKASDRMQVLIKDLLDYSLIGSKKTFKKVDCNVILKDVLADLGTAIRETQAEIQLEKLPFINGYDIEIKQLFQNLIINSIKFRKKDIAPQIKISVQTNDDCWEFIVKDNGIGIDEQHNDRIFVIFQRLHTRTVYEGSGIGLSHCKKIVELHGGRIWFESKPDEGTTFHFTIQKKIGLEQENKLSIAC